MQLIGFFKSRNRLIYQRYIDYIGINRPLRHCFQHSATKKGHCFFSWMIWTDGVYTN